MQAADVATCRGRIPTSSWNSCPGPPKPGLVYVRIRAVTAGSWLTLSSTGNTVGVVKLVGTMALLIPRTNRRLSMNLSVGFLPMTSGVRTLQATGSDPPDVEAQFSSPACQRWMFPKLSANNMTGIDVLGLKVIMVVTRSPTPLNQLMAVQALSTKSNANPEFMLPTPVKLLIVG